MGCDFFRLVACSAFLLPVMSAFGACSGDIKSLKGLVKHKVVPSPLGPEMKRNSDRLAIYILQLEVPLMGVPPWGKRESGMHLYRELQVNCNTYFLPDCGTVLKRSVGYHVSLTGAVSAAVEPNDVLPMTIEPCSIEKPYREKQ